jgi:hypothetical protein
MTYNDNTPNDAQSDFTPADIGSALPSDTANGADGTPPTIPPDTSATSVAPDDRTAPPLLASARSISPSCSRSTSSRAAWCSSRSSRRRAW